MDLYNQFKPIIDKFFLQKDKKFKSLLDESFSVESKKLFGFYSMGSFSRMEPSAEFDRDSFIVFAKDMSQGDKNEILEKLIAILDEMQMKPCEAKLSIDYTQWQGDELEWQKRVSKMLGNLSLEDFIKIIAIKERRFIFGNSALCFEMPIKAHKKLYQLFSYNFILSFFNYSLKKLRKEIFQLSTISYQYTDQEALSIYQKLVLLEQQEILTNKQRLILSNSYYWIHCSQINSELIQSAGSPSSVIAFIKVKLTLWNVYLKYFLRFMVR